MDDSEMYRCFDSKAMITHLDQDTAFTQYIQRDILSTLARSNFSWPQSYKTFFMLHSVEHEIFSANKLEMPTIVDIFYT